MTLGKPIEHTIVVRVRDGKIELSADELTITPKETLTWVLECGEEKFEVQFKDPERDPFGPGGPHRSVGGKKTVGPPKIPGADKGKAPKKGCHVKLCYDYTVRVEGCPPLDPRIVFEIPPTDGRG